MIISIVKIKTNTNSTNIIEKHPSILGLIDVRAEIGKIRGVFITIGTVCYFTVSVIIDATTYSWYRAITSDYHHYSLEHFIFQ